MAWLRIDDRVRTHPKIAQAGPAAAWLWFCGICYCREHLTDGFVPKAVVPTLAMNLPSPWKHAARLVEVRLWETASGGYQVHDFLEWNPSREDVMSQRDKERDKKRNQRSVPRGQVGDSHARAHDRAGDAGSGSVLPSEDLDLQLEEIPISTMPPTWRKGPRRTDPAMRDLDYHRRNCPIDPFPWAEAACEAGLCVPKYLWPQWERRQDVDTLAAFVRAWAPRAGGDRAEDFWPRAFAEHFGVTAPASSRTGDTVSAARAFLTDRVAGLVRGDD